jgi:DegV family protein with EDD domain
MTDSVSSISKDMVKKYNITVIPFHVIMDGKDYLETEIGMERIYARLKEKENIPTSSFPSSGEFLQVYQELSQKIETILYICFTSAFSKGYGAAIEAKEMAREKLPKTRIEVIDSRTVTAGELLIVLEAAKAAAQGKSLKEIIEIANSIIPRMNLIETRDTLFYIDKGGRIFEAKSWAEAESVGNFRAITECDSSTGGITRPLARAKTQTQIMKKMVDIAKERAGDKKLHAAIVHASVPDKAEQLKELILPRLHCDEFYVSEHSAMSAIHNGEGFISFGFYSSS